MQIQNEINDLFGKAQNNIDTSKSNQNRNLNKINPDDTTELESDVRDIFTCDLGHITNLKSYEYDSLFIDDAREKELQLKKEAELKM